MEMPTAALIEEIPCPEVHVSDIHEVVRMDGEVHIVWQTNRPDQDREIVPILAARFICTEATLARIVQRLINAMMKGNVALSGGVNLRN